MSLLLAVRTKPGWHRRTVFSGLRLGRWPCDLSAVSYTHLDVYKRQVLIHDLRQSEKGLSFLATTGSAAPFIGLFGTVWGLSLIHI